MKLIEKKENQMKFIAEINTSLANAIRRFVGEIPVIAVDEVEISKNDSALYDETLAHRIGLVPLKMDNSITEKKIPTLKLNVKKEGLVYSEELKGNIKIPYGKIPLTLLKKGQEIELLATVKFGKGNEHAKFSPGLMFYREIAEIKIEKDCPKEVVDVCPKKILEIENGKVVAKDNYKCDFCEACVEVCKKNKKDSIKLKPTKEMMIMLESFGQLSVEQIFKKAISVLKKDLEKVSKNLK